MSARQDKTVTAGNEGGGDSAHRMARDSTVVKWTSSADFSKAISDVGLFETGLFAGCKTAIQNIPPKVFKKSPPYEITYSLGDPLIEISNENGEPRPPEDQFRLPGGTPAAQTPKLTSNPLFVILKGYVEVHRTVVFGSAKLEETTVPVITLSTGDTFGEFELDLGNAKAAWHNYLAEATAGWRSMTCASSFTDGPCWNAVAGLSSQPRDDMGRLLRLSYAHLSNVHGLDEEKFSYVTKLAIVPRELIDHLMAHSLAFVRNLFRALLDHTMAHISLSGVAGKNMLNLQTIGKHFVETIIPKCLSGLLPVLVPCTYFPELKPWWNAFHRNLLLTDNLNSCNLPYLFYVPVTGLAHASCSKDARLEVVRFPVLNRAMIRAYTQDLILGNRRITKFGRDDRGHMSRKVCANTTGTYGVEQDALDVIAAFAQHGTEGRTLDRLPRPSMKDRMSVLSDALGLDQAQAEQLEQAVRQQGSAQSSATYKAVTLQLPVVAGQAHTATFTPKDVMEPRNIYYFKQVI